MYRCLMPQTNLEMNTNNYAVYNDYNDYKNNRVQVQLQVKGIEYSQ